MQNFVDNKLQNSKNETYRNKKFIRILYETTFKI